MKVAILFWCYKELGICEDRLKHLRSENPETPIYLLYGGDPRDAGKYKETLSTYVDDFYVDDEEPPAGAEELLSQFRGGTYWKYFYGDLLLASWYRNAGINLEWDTVVLVQWDMLVFGSVPALVGFLQEDEILLSGVRPVREVENHWAWVAPSQPENRKMYLDFLAYVREKYGYDQEPVGFLAIVLALPRKFLEKFSRIERPELGFMEYRIPIYAQIFGTPICQGHPFTPWWAAVEPYHWGTTLRARPWPVPLFTILFNLLKPGGARIFHPYWGKVPKGMTGWGTAILNSFLRTLRNVFAKSMRIERFLQDRQRAIGRQL